MSKFAGRLRVAHVLDTTSRLAGGMFESAKGLARGMAAAGHDVHVLAGTDAFTAADLSSWEPLVPRVAASSGIADGVFGRALLRTMLDTDPDLVHLHGIWGVGARATSAWQRRTGRPVVISPRGMLDGWARARSAGKKRASALLWEGRLLADAHFLHALAESEAQAITAAGLRRPIVTIPNGVSLPDTVAAATAGGRKGLLFLGRLHPKKGLAELLRAWALLPQAVRAEWVLQIAGWDEIGLEASLREQAAASGIGEDVAFLGGRFGADKAAAFAAASAFVLPSYSEGLPMAVLEGWSYRLPVFMTQACNLPEGFSAGAAFEISTDPQAMAQVFAATLPDAAALVAAGERGRALVERRHAWPVISAEMWDAYGRFG